MRNLEILTGIYNKYEVIEETGCCQKVRREYDTKQGAEQSIYT